MALSTTIKNKMLSVTHLKYRLLVEIKNEDGNWIDFTDRDPRPSSARLSTEKKRNQIVSSVASISFTNDDNYFDYMDNPDNATTVSLFGILASKFSNGFRGKEVRISLRVSLPDGTYEDARLGIFRIRRKKQDLKSQRTTFDLWQDVDFLKKIGSESISDGLKHHQNKPVTYLVKELLKRFYTDGVTASEFEIPDRIYLETADGEPAFSHYGKPPEKDTSGRWRSDVEHKPTAMYYHSDDGYFYFGIGDEVWQFDPVDEEWKLCGIFGDDDLQVRGIYRMTSTRLLVVGWKYNHTSRYVTLKTGSVLTTTPIFTPNDPGYDSAVFSGEFVLRDTLITSYITTPAVGRIKNDPLEAGDEKYGCNMPVPFPHYFFSGCNGSFKKTMGFVASDAGDGLGKEIPSANWTLFETSDDPHGIISEEAGYIAYHNEALGSSSIRPELLVCWGMKPNLTWADDPVDFTGPYLFTVETDGNPLGIRCAGDVQIIAYSAYGGTHFTVSENAQGGDLAPIYGLQYYNQGSIDYLYWIDVNWVETYGVSPPDPPIFRIKIGTLTDNSGNPQLLDSNRYTLWTSGDNIFAIDDSEYAAIMVYPYPLGSSIEGFLIQMMDMSDMGGECFKLFRTPVNMATATELATSRMGWGSFSPDYPNDKIYFIDRDSGRVGYIDISSAPGPSDVHWLDDGAEPVPQSFFEMPQAEGFVIRTESSKVCLYGCMYPYLPGWVNESLIWISGKYYFWKYHFQLTDRVEFFEEDRQTAWEALGLLGEAVRYQVGLDPDGTGFFRPIPDGSGSVEFTIDLDSPIGRHIKVKKLGGEDEIVNRSQFIPYDVIPGVPEATLDLIGYASGGEQVYFDGVTNIKSETLIEKNVTLHCIKGGEIETAAFKYLIHDYQIQTFLREDVSLGSPTQIRVDNNTDLEVGMLVQVGDWDVGAKISTIQSDGDIILDTSLTTVYKQGTPVIFRSAEHGKWSTEYDTPAEYTTASSFSEIASTGLFLKFEENPGTTNNFAIGDRIRIFNPGMKLSKSRTKKFMAEDSDSVEKYGASEYNIDNPYISLALGRELTQGIIDNDAERHHGWEIDCPLFLQARPLVLVTMKSRKHLPTATNNEEKCYIKQVTHDRKKARSKLILRAVSNYG